MIVMMRRKIEELACYVSFLENEANILLAGNMRDCVYKYMCVVRHIILVNMCNMIVIIYEAEYSCIQ